MPADFPECNPFAILKTGRLTPVHLGRDWTPATAGSGATLYEIMLQRLSVGAAVGEALLKVNTYGFTPGLTWYYFDFDKEFLMSFSITRNINDTNNEGVGYFQVKEAQVHGDLAAKGLGIKIDGANSLALTGESYGTARGTVNLGNLTLDMTHWIVIHHRPGEFIKWYINGVLTGTQNTLANIPSGQTAGTTRFVHSLNAGAGTSAQIFFFLLGTIVCWQEA